MKIAVIGTGNVGSTLGVAWAKRGHEVAFGSRDPQSTGMLKLVVDAGQTATVTTSPEAAAGAEVVVLATPWDVTEAVVVSLGDLTGKIVIDCTNPLKPGLAGLAVGGDTSGAERIAAVATGARVVKAFNTTGARNMADPAYGGGRLVMLIAGDDGPAKVEAARLAGDLGFEAVDAGPLSQARYLEPLAMLWITLAYVQGLGPDFGFALVRRE